MVWKFLSGMAGLVLALLAVIAVNTLRIGPPATAGNPTANENRH